MLSGRLRTWPYGTKKRVTVLDAPHQSVLVVSDGDEGFVLIDAIPANVNKGDTGVITYTDGGPLGGYWHFQPDPKDPLS